MARFLNQIYEQNPWFKHHQNIDSDVHLERLKKYPYVWQETSFLNHPFADGVYFVYGIRQIGKTTHLKMLIKNNLHHHNAHNYFYFNCDFLDSKQDVVELVEEYLTHFADLSNRVFVILDEITSIPDSVLAIKYLIDSGKYKNITYILSGSSSVNIKKTGEYLPGRKGKGVDFIFYPLSFYDFMEMRKPGLKDVMHQVSPDTMERKYYEVISDFPLSETFDSYLVCGGIPRLINEFYMNDKNIDYEILEIYKSWIISEIIKNGKKEYIVKILLNRILESITSSVSYNAFLQDAGIGSHNTVHDYLDFLENAFIIKQVYHFDFFQKKVNYRKNKKIYFIDPFVSHLVDWWLNSRSKLSVDFLQSSILKSRIVENVVFNHLFKLQGNEVFFYKNNYEIDFVDRNDRMVEVKYRNKIVKEDFTNLSKIKTNRDKIVLSKNDFIFSDDVKVIPVDFYLLMAKKYI
ncbi:MAG: ATP-binding protein [Candidatus Aminicenantes bacterium]|nr:MAG: ATP-binding protein [Candidatus Aminicenantes bacterium]